MKIKKFAQYINESTDLDSLFLGKTILDIMDLSNELRVGGVSGIKDNIIVAMDSFKTFDDASEYLIGKGYSIGRRQYGSPTGIKEGVYDIQKWRNLGRDMNRLDGIIITIEGECYVLYFEFPS